jgi:hypothetical protein
MAMTYDRGGRIVGMIEDRLQPAGFLDFMKRVRRKYEYRILRVADYQRELEAYTGHSWQEFFDNWLYKTCMTDWCIEHVNLSERPAGGAWTECTGPLQGQARTVQHATVVLRQKGECNEPTWLGFRFDHSDGYQLKIPIHPGEPNEYSSHVTCAPDGAIVVDIDLPARPTQIAVDPDKVLLDRDPTNNTWKADIHFRVAPVYTQLEETDIANCYDRWNVIVGPWFYGSSYNDPWYTRSAMVGLRAGAFRTQEFSGGAYLAYRTDDRNLVAGVDGIWDHFPLPHMQVGFNIERSLTTLSEHGDVDSSRGVVFARYVFMYGDSLYLPPFHYIEAFGAVLNNPLPPPDVTIPGAQPFNNQSVLGIHYHINFLTPYWDPEAGFAFDAVYQHGLPIFGEEHSSDQISAQVSCVKGMPDWMNWTREVPGLGWFMDSRVALRLHGAAGLPLNGRLFAMGGDDLFRGYDLSQRQGSANWIGSVEYRVPLWQDIEYGVCDNIAVAKNLYAALFCDVGNAYLEGHSLGPTAYALGVGLRLDVSWFGLIERTTLRFDVAKTVNDNSPWQFWFGIQHPF